jgi:hypothetical protein
MNAPVTKRQTEGAAEVDPLAKLREPFPPNAISKLPKESKAQIDERKQNRAAGVSCKVCGSWHHKNAVHLDYVGHAALTDRLLDVDPLWSWEPVAFAADGLPAFDRNGGLWIKLTVCGVTRLGYGNADGKSGGDAVKEIIGDALRNAAMRFGAALDLWHKGDLHPEEPEAPAPSLEERAISHLRACAIDRATFKDAWESNKDGWRKAMADDAYARVIAEMKALAAKLPKDEPPPAPEPIDDVLRDDEIPY